MIMIHKRKLLILIVICLGTILLVVGCGSKKEEESEQAGKNVVASTSWTAAIAKAAGAEDVTILAPIELRHPPEYDFRPSDIDKVSKADFIVYAGYEPFMNNLLDSADVAEENLYAVRTENTPENLKEQAGKLAEEMDTVAAFEKWEEEFDHVMDQILAEGKEQNITEKKAVVQAHMVPMVELMGFTIIAEFAEDLSPEKTAELANLEPDIVIDNFHNAQGEAIAEIADVERVELRNFPKTEDQMIQELLQDNAEALGLKVE